MLSEITTGNAAIDGKDFHHWFVGEIEEWCRRSQVPFNTVDFGLRNTKDLEIKWGIHPKDEGREDWACPTEKIAMSVLISGDFIIRFRDQNSHSQHEEVRLKTVGDFAIWKDDVEHLWKAEQDSVVLTIRWPSGRCESAAES